MWVEQTWTFDQVVQIDEGVPVNVFMAIPSSDHLHQGRSGGHLGLEII